MLGGSDLLRSNPGVGLGFSPEAIHDNGFLAVPSNFHPIAAVFLGDDPIAGHRKPWRFGHGPSMPRFVVQGSFLRIFALTV